MTIQRHVWTHLPQRTYTTKLVLQKSWQSTTQTILKSVSFESFSIFVESILFTEKNECGLTKYSEGKCNAALIYCGRCVCNFHSYHFLHFFHHSYAYSVYISVKYFLIYRLYIICNNCITLRLIIMWIDWLDLMQMLFCLFFSFALHFYKFFHGYESYKFTKKCRFFKIYRS